MKLHLLSLEELNKKEKCRIPYIYQFSKKEKSLLVIGSRHTNNSKDSQFKEFKEKFDSFKPQVVFVEGGAERSKIDSEKDAIFNGEMAFIAYLSKNKGISVLSWEPDYKTLYSKLLKKFSKEEIFAESILQIIPQWVAMNKPEDYFEKFIWQFKNYTNWKGFDYSFNNLNNIHKETLGIDIPKEPSKHQIDFYSFNPMTPNVSTLHRVSGYEMRLRDENAVKVITKAFSKYDKILAVMGSSHAEIQETAYQVYFK